MRLAMIGLGKMGGNSNDHDSLSRGAWLAERAIGVMDGGTSGGVWGLENGYCPMVGGTAETAAIVRPALEALALGEGLPTVQEAIEQGVPAPVLTLALQMRVASQDEEGYGFRLLSVMRNRFGGHAMKKAA